MAAILDLLENEVFPKENLDGVLCVVLNTSTYRVKSCQETFVNIFVNYYFSICAPKKCKFYTFIRPWPWKWPQFDLLQIRNVIKYNPLKKNCEKKYCMWLYDV